MPVSHERNRIILARNISTSENEWTMAAPVSSARHNFIEIYVRGGLQETQSMQIHYLRKIGTCLSILNCLFYTNNNGTCTRNSSVLFIHSLIAKNYI